jgi:hypothetical protein
MWSPGTGSENPPHLALSVEKNQSGQDAGRGFRKQMFSAQCQESMFVYEFDSLCWTGRSEEFPLFGSQKHRFEHARRERQD